MSPEAAVLRLKTLLARIREMRDAEDAGEPLQLAGVDPAFQVFRHPDTDTFELKFCYRSPKNRRGQAAIFGWLASTIGALAYLFYMAGLAKAGTLPAIFDSWLALIPLPFIWIVCGAIGSVIRLGRLDERLRLLVSPASITWDTLNLAVLAGDPAQGDAVDRKPAFKPLIQVVPDEREVVRKRRRMMRTRSLSDRETPWQVVMTLGLHGVGWRTIVHIEGANGHDAAVGLAAVITMLLALTDPDNADLEAEADLDEASSYAQPLTPE